MDCNLPGSSVRGILQARVLEWVANSFSIRSDQLLSRVGVAQTVKHLPTMRETWVQPLGQEDPLEKEMATHSSILA